MNSIRLLEKLREKTVFRVQDIERIAYCERSYAKQILNRLKSRNLIRQVTRNAYTTKDNIYVIASNIKYPSYISFWTASHFLGYTEQIVNTIQVATTAKAKSINFDNYRIKFIEIPHFFGYRKMRTSGGPLFVAEDEKLLIDAFLRHKECGNFDEIEKMFVNASVSEEKMIDYLKKVGSQTIVKRIGFMLEKFRGIDISEHFELDKNYVSLNPFSGSREATSSKWRVRT